MDPRHSFQKEWDDDDQVLACERLHSGPGLAEEEQDQQDQDQDPWLSRLSLGAWKHNQNCHHAFEGARRAWRTARVIQRHDICGAPPARPARS